MRFLILTQYFPPEVGASQTRLLAVAQTLKGLGHDVRVVTGMPNYPDGGVKAPYRGRVFLREDRGGLPVTRVWLYPAKGIGWRRLANYLSFAATALFGLARSPRPDVVYVESPPLTLVPAGVLAARLWRVPIVMFVADPWPDSAVEVGALKPGRLLDAARRLERWAYRNVDGVLTPTRGLVEHLRAKGVGSHRLVFLPNGVDTALFAPRERDRDMANELGIEEDDRVVLYAGTVGRVHGVEVAVNAMSRLRETHPRVRLLIVGAGSDLDAVRRLAAKLRLTNVSFVEPQSLERLARTWTLADVGLSTQRDLPVAEITRPVKIFAAMASGKAVAYSGSGEGARLVQEADAGVVVPPEDPSALARAIAELVDDPERAAQLGTNGRRYVEDNLTWDCVVEDWIAQLERMRS
ncbi:MAG: glycosyltransferase family 4 protein [Gemmatimonadales bacterium]